MPTTPAQNESSSEYKTTYHWLSREALFQLSCALTLGLALLVMSSVPR